MVHELSTNLARRDILGDECDFSRPIGTRTYLPCLRLQFITRLDRRCETNAEHFQCARIAFRNLLDDTTSRKSVRGQAM